MKSEEKHNIKVIAKAATRFRDSNRSGTQEILSKTGQ